MRANSAMRGVTIAERLRRQEGSEDNMVSARLVYLHTPATSNGPVTSGVAVLHSGEFMGQRVEFDRAVCTAFGFSLHKADLSHLFEFGKKKIIYKIETATCCQLKEMKFTSV